MNWTSELSRGAEEQLRRLPRTIQKRIAQAIDAMERNPFEGNIKALKGKQWKGRFRKRVGDYRIIFIPDHTKRRITISAILPRSEKTYK
jgi:mRNA-degrading endonuclease RelE of RelBE toxin-antitoxin system